MRILRNIVLMALPILLMINLYRWVNFNNMGTPEEYAFRGFAYLHQYFSTFPGISGTLQWFEYVQATNTSITNIEISSLADVFEAFGLFIQMFGMVFAIPIMIIVDIVRDIIWVINMFFIQ